MEKMQMWVAWHLPKWLVMWATVRLAAHATTGKYGTTVVPELTVIEALRRWDHVVPIVPLVSEMGEKDTPPC